MNCDVGSAAGRVWVVLGDRGETNITELPKILKLKTHTAYQALGWLLKEGKICQEQKSGKTFVSLTRRELDIFNGLS
jgi:hypothetical protein